MFLDCLFRCDLGMQHTKCMQSVQGVVSFKARLYTHISKTRQTYMPFISLHIRCVNISSVTL